MVLGGHVSQHSRGFPGWFAIRHKVDLTRAAGLTAKRQRPVDVDHLHLMARAELDGVDLAFVMEEIRGALPGHWRHWYACWMTGVRRFAGYFL
jgi:hypothetical protein